MPRSHQFLNTDIWYGDHRFDARWISYNDFQDDVLRPEAAKTIDPEKTGPRPGKEAPHLSELPPHFTKMFSQKAVRKDNPDLEFLRNKHIVVLGSSWVALMLLTLFVKHSLTGTDSCRNCLVL